MSTAFIDAFIEMCADAPQLAREARWAANEERVRRKFSGMTVDQVLAMWDDPEQAADCDDIWLFLALHGAADGLI